MLVHALADVTAMHAREPHGDEFAALTGVMFVVLGVVILSGRASSTAQEAERTTA